MASVIKKVRMGMTKVREDAGTTECSRLKQIAAKGFGATFDAFATCVIFVCFTPTFGRRLCAMFFDIHPKIMRQLNWQSTFGEKTKYIAAVHTENA